MQVFLLSYFTVTGYNVLNILFFFYKKLHAFELELFWYFYLDILVIIDLFGSIVLNN